MAKQCYTFYYFMQRKYRILVLTLATFAAMC